MVLARIPLVENDVSGLDGQLPPGRHRVTGVHREVHHDLLDLTGVGLHAAERGCRQQRQRDIGTEQATQHLLHAGEHLV